MKRLDLNESMILDDGCQPCIPLENFNGAFESAELWVYFKDLEGALVGLINEHASVYGPEAAVIGCVAWLTSTPILTALRQVRCSIIVQKEDLWRPDIGKRNDWSKAKIRAQYDALDRKGGERIYRGSFIGKAFTLNTHGDPSIEAVRCVGNLNTSCSPAFPRSHHKFLVLGRLRRSGPPGEYMDESWEPQAVWTGSFNFTHNAVMSFENAVLIRNGDVGKLYTLEWSQILALSESLDYDSEWIAPDYRVGT